MKLITYTLNPDGTVPDYVIDGGYLAWANGGVSPQDYDLIGVAIDDAQQAGFANEAALLTYVQEKGFTFIDPITKEKTLIETVVASIWAKIITIGE
jgi:hypothetical protein